MANFPTIEGAGNGPKKPKKKYIKNKPPKKGPKKPPPKKVPPKKGPEKPKPNRPKQPKPMPYYPETGSNEKPSIQRKPDLKDALIKIWNDRNSSNDGTKLNR